jgi:CBS domain-containing protein
MNPNPVFLRTSDTIARGAKLIMAKQRRSLPVVDRDSGRLLGTISYYGIGARIMGDGF